MDQYVDKGCFVRSICIDDEDEGDLDPVLVEKLRDSLYSV